jgi:hypothetical protein
VKRADLLGAADPERFATDVPANRPAGDGGHHHGPIETVREDTYRGHHIVVRTTYEITVDGEQVSGHLAVDNDGSVHYHPLPNYESPSAIGMVRALIDAFPDDFDTPPDPDPHHGPGHRDDHGDHDTERCE